jgi:hypothetical protein
MLIIRFWWLCFFGLLIAANSLAQAPRGYTVAVQPVLDAVPFGASVPISFTLKNDSTEELPLTMDWTGRPSGLMHVSNESGETLPEWGRYRIEAGPQRSQAETTYRMKPGEQIRLHHDLGDIFGFIRSKPGKHTLQFVTVDGVVAKAEFIMVACRTVSSRELSGAYDPLQYGEGGNATASARLSIVESQEAASRRQWLLLDQVTIRGELKSRLPSYSCPIEIGSAIEKAEFDHLGQVWVVLKSGNRASLLVWRMHELQWAILVTMTDQKIGIGTAWAITPSTPAQPYNVVIAGIEGQTKFTTESVWAMPRAEPSVAPTQSPATRPAP